MTRREAQDIFRRADEFFRAGWYQDALVLLEELAEAYPKNHRIEFPRARCLAEMGRLDEALDLLERMIEREHYYRAINLKGLILDKIARDDDAATDIATPRPE